MINFILLIDLNGVDTHNLGKEGVRVLAQMLVVFREYRHEKVFFFLFDLLNQKALVMCFNKRHATFS